MAKAKQKTDLLQGTLDMLILRALGGGSMHGYAIVRRIQEVSDSVLRVEEGSLYPALHRMERRGWIESEWGLSETKRRAKYYQLTEAGNAQAKVETDTWLRLSDAVGRVLDACALEGT